MTADERSENAGQLDRDHRRWDVSIKKAIHHYLVLEWCEQLPNFRINFFCGRNENTNRNMPLKQSCEHITFYEWGDLLYWSDVESVCWVISDEYRNTSSVLEGISFIHLSSQGDNLIFDV